ncbi:MAG: MFS transporter [Candidatus Gottesmanbacteria bacterium]
MSIFNTEERNLMFIQSMNYFSAGLAGIFVTVYFYSHSDLKTTIFYNLLFYTTLLIVYIASGWTLKKVSSAFLIKFGIFIAAIFYLLLFLLKENIIYYVIPLGIFSGFGAGNYWAGLNLNQYIFTNKKKRLEYFGSMNTILNILQSVSPLIGGGIIILAKSSDLLSPQAGYAILFLIVFILLFLMILVVGKLPNHEMPNFSYAHITSHQRSRNWKFVLCQQAVWGSFDVAMSTVLGILFFLILKNEIILGASQTAIFLLSAVGSLISIRILTKNRQSYWFGVVGVALGMTSFALFQNTYGLILFVILYGLFSPFLYNMLSATGFRVMDSVDTSWKEKYHFLIERDIALGIPRMLSYIFLLIFLQFGDQIQLARIWLYFLPFLPLILGFLLWKMKSLPSSSLEALA